VGETNGRDKRANAIAASRLFGTLARPKHTVALLADALEESLARTNHSFGVW